MKLAKASQAEITTLCRWLQAKDAAKFENAKDRPPAFMRVIFGYETLVNNCCDPTKDTLEWKPGYSPSEVDAQRAALKELLASVTSKGADDTASPIAWSGSASQNRRMYAAISAARAALGTS